MLRLFLGGLASPASHRRTLETFRDDALDRLATYAAIDERIGRKGHDLFHGAVLDLGIARAEASRDWVETQLDERG